MRLGRHFRHLDATIDKLYELAERLREGEITALAPMALRGKQPGDFPCRFLFIRESR